MPGIVRVNADVHQGHSGRKVPFHKTHYASGSPDVFINNEEVVRVGDKCACGDTAVGSSSNVYVNGKLVHRLGDATSGHGAWVPNAAETASPNVFAN